MNIGTAAVLIILSVIVFLVIRSMIRDKRNGKSLQCGMNCKNCGRHCTGHETGV